MAGFKAHDYSRASEASFDYLADLILVWPAA